MAISMRDTGRRELGDPNLTPMIDVLLVLLVIFMIAQPLLQKTMDVQLPRNDGDFSPGQIVLGIDQGGYRLNTHAIARAELPAQLTELYRNRPQKVILVKADPNVVYQDVIEAMDIARGAGVKVIGAVLPN